MAGENRVRHGRRSLTSFVLRIAEGQAASACVGLSTGHDWKHVLLYPDSDLGRDCIGRILSAVEAVDWVKNGTKLQANSNA